MSLLRKLFAGNKDAATSKNAGSYRRDLTDDEISTLPVDELRSLLKNGKVGAHITIIILCHDQLGRSPQERGKALGSVYPQMLAMCNDRKRYLGYFTGVKGGKDIEIAIASPTADEQVDLVSTSIQFARSSDGVRFLNACKELIGRVGFTS